MTLHDQIISYLENHNVMSLATTGADGPWASAVFFANEGLDIYFLSSPTTRHALNLAGDARVGATVQEDYARWELIKGVQLEGVAKRLNDDATGHARALFEKKFPFVGSDQAAAQIAAAMQKVGWYRLSPSRAYFIDNSKGLGHRDRLDLASG